MYSDYNFKTKKALITAVEQGARGCHQPGPFGPSVANGEHCCEGPHYPQPHRWYATVKVRGGCIIGVKDSKGKWHWAPEA